MARETSPYEGKFDNSNGRTALGRIVDVDIANRRCRIKTIGLKGKTDDHDIPDVKWITTDGGSGGAEDTSIPKIGQIGVILYINNQPYIVGYYRSLNLAPQDVPPDTETDPQEALLNQGDRILKTIAGNSIILRSGGSIEIQSTALCRTYWLPTNVMNSVCGNYELETDGGFMSWELDKDTSATTLSYFIQDNQQPTNVIDAQYGTSDLGNVVDVTIGEVNKEDFEFTNEKVHLQVQPDGSILIEIGNILSGTPKAKLTINALTGDTVYETEGNMTQKIKGNLAMTITGNVTETVSGNVTQTVTGKMKSDVTGDVTVKAGGAAKVESGAKATIKGASGVDIDGGGGAVGQALVFPQALSDFTGAPVMPGSSTVNVSL